MEPQRQNNKITVYVNFYPNGEAVYHRSAELALEKANKRRVMAIAVPVTLEMPHNVQRNEAI